MPRSKNRPPQRTPVALKKPKPTYSPSIDQAEAFTNCSLPGAGIYEFEGRSQHPGHPSSQFTAQLRLHCDGVVTGYVKDVSGSACSVTNGQRGAGVLQFELRVALGGMILSQHRYKGYASTLTTGANQLQVRGFFARPCTFAQGSARQIDPTAAVSNAPDWMHGVEVVQTNNGRRWRGRCL